MTTEQRIQAAIEHSKKRELNMAIGQLVMVCRNQQEEIEMLKNACSWLGAPVYDQFGTSDNPVTGTQE
jgi:nitrite reductase/ring-hydroxylating ferredoxin subunit